MIKTIIDKFIRAALDELFINAPSVQLSMGADLFSDSNINISNLNLRPDVFDVYAQPFRLVSGHVGQISAEGIAELALGGKLKFQADSIYLLFQLDTVVDPEKVQTMKKIMLELQGSKFSVDMLMDLLRRIQGLGPITEVDLLKKRKVIYKALDYLSKGVFISIKNVHVRFEFPDGEGKFDAFGLKLPLVRIHPGSPSLRPDGLSRQDPLLSIQVKQLQLYCDYKRASYDQGAPERTRATFDQFSKGGLHTSLVVPFDMDVIVGLDIKRRSGVVCPKVSIHASHVRFCFDQLQVAALGRILQAVLRTQKRFEQAVKVQKIFRAGFPLPRMYQVVGVRCLPHLLVRNEQYPKNITLAGVVTAEGSGLVAFMKERVGSRWALMLWKHLYRVVVSDLRTVRPLGRWREIARLTALRRDYVFAYAKLLTRSSSGAADMPHFIFNVNAPMSVMKLRDLFECEMQLSPQAVMIFRSLAHMVVIVTSFNLSRKPTGAKDGPGPWEKTCIGWNDILRTYVELWEAKRESSFHRFDRNQEAGSADDYDDTYSVTDDVHSATGKNSDEGTIHSYAVNSRTPVKQKSGAAAPAATASSRTAAAPTTGAPQGRSFFGGFGFGSSSGQSVSSHGQDDYDSKVMKKLDLSVFGSAFGALRLRSDKAKEDAAGGEAMAGANVAAADAEKMLRRATPLPGAKFPQLGVIAEAVQWAISRYQSSLTVLPPDLTAKVEHLSAELKTPLHQTWSTAAHAWENSYQEPRMTLLSANAQQLQLTLNISQSSSNDAASKRNSVAEGRGFDYLSGALIQIKAVVGQCNCTLAVPPMLGGAAAPLSPAKSRRRPHEAGTTLTSGLPVYPINRRGDDEDDDDDDGRRFETGSAHGGSQDSTVQMPPPSTPPRNPDGVEWKNIPGVANPNVKYIPGKTLLESLQEKQQQEEAKQQEEALRKPAKDAEGGTAGGRYSVLSIETSMDDMSLAAASSVSIYDNIKYVQKEFLSSAPGDQVLIVCLIFDLDNKGEGAGDVQCHLGSVRLDLSNAVLTALLSPLLLQTTRTIQAAQVELAASSVMLGDPALLMDWSAKRPLVHSLFSRLEFMESLTQAVSAASATEAENGAAEREYEQLLQPVDAAEEDGESGAGEEDEPAEVSAAVAFEDESDDDGDRSADEASVSSAGASFTLPTPLVTDPRATTPIPPVADPAPTPAPSSREPDGAEVEFVAYQRALLLHRNMAQWLSLLTAYLPKVLSVSLRVSTILVQSLEANIVRDLIHARLHSMVDLAAHRSNVAADQYLFGVNSMQGLLANLLIAALDPAALAVQLGDTTKGRGAYAAYSSFRRIRKWGVRGGGAPANATDPDQAPGVISAPSASSAKVKVLVPALDIAVMKAMLPMPSLALHWQAMTVLQVPVSDETLCHYLAFVLAQAAPFFYY